MSELVYYDLKRSASMSPSLSVQVAREIGRRIVAGTFEPGTLIEDEGALAERYQVSRVVVRDAVKILVGKGLLEVRRGIGTKVRPRSQWMMLDDDVLAWHLSAPPNPDLLKQLMDIRCAFEPKAARWAAERATKEDVAEIEAACVRMETEKGTVENFIIADAMFHRAVLRAAHNEFLKAMEGVIYSALLVSIRITNKDPRENETSIPFHRAVYEAIAQGDADLAEELTQNLLGDANARLQAKAKPKAKRGKAKRS
ncbi:MAG: FadR family transcriptional regulator [Gammaproteobacteria bacterium]|uniref:FadR/GntR family transcriptional regulator n=1 Tax=Pseudomaricurvus alcaniphilus TaxID=1166482 RepID=UPI00140C83F9|nr:FadR/GntR family transcriptional regulator [Pseudomaricurvus alcaniphilus]MBR9912740.1 FadR family transcriptional regulator [Gammaproteobacteria bacterium]NHN39798.1 FadR family transcriptional regulator [Pseudomaricurvus alcaniphilus]